MNCSWPGLRFRYHGLQYGSQNSRDPPSRGVDRCIRSKCSSSSREITRSRVLELLTWIVGAREEPEISSLSGTTCWRFFPLARRDTVNMEMRTACRYTALREILLPSSSDNNIMNGCTNPCLRAGNSSTGHGQAAQINSWKNIDPEWSMVEEISSLSTINTCVHGREGQLITSQNWKRKWTTGDTRA